jgi:hypothetical protein
MRSKFGYKPELILNGLIYGARGSLTLHELSCSLSIWKLIKPLDYL